MMAVSYPSIGLRIKCQISLLIFRWKSFGSGSWKKFVSFVWEMGSTLCSSLRARFSSFQKLGSPIHSNYCSPSRWLYRQTLSELLNDSLEVHSSVHQCLSCSLRKVVNDKVCQHRVILSLVQLDTIHKKSLLRSELYGGNWLNKFNIRLNCTYHLTVDFCLCTNFWTFHQDSHAFSFRWTSVPTTLDESHCHHKCHCNEIGRHGERR